MKKNASGFVSILLVFAVGLVFTNSAQAFQQPSHVTLPGQAIPAPSPLSGLEAAIEPPGYYSSTVPATQFVTHQVDLRETLLDHAVEHKCSINEAFLKLEKQLRMKPLGPIGQGHTNGKSSSKNALYKLVGDDVYAISAQQFFFNALQMKLSQFRYGDKQIVVEVRFFDIEQSDVAKLQTFMIPGTFEVFGNRLPLVKSFASNGTFASLKDAEGSVKNGFAEKVGSTNATFVRATETKTKAYPTFIGQLDERGANQIVQFSKSRSLMNIIQSPNITMFPGQRATVSDGLTRPFVVSVKKITDGTATGYQPVIQLLEDGTKIALLADISAGKIKLRGDVAFSKVLGVETFDYPTVENAEGTSVTIQVPEHRIRKVHWAAEVNSNHSILIDSVETFEKEIKPKTRFKPAITKSMRTLIMITPRLVKQTGVVENKSSQRITRLPRQ